MRNPVAPWKKTAVGAGLFIVCALALPGAAHAEGGLFGAIFNAIGRVIAPQSHSRTEQQSEPFPDIFNSSGATVKPAEGGSRVSYCVRSCDGRYFPIPNNAGSVSPAQMCQSICPAAETAVYSGSTIENATSREGNKYSELANAFLYRKKIVNGCSCNQKSPVGNASINYRNDPTLRPGDIVMTGKGPVVFKGAVGPTHQLSDFVPARDSKRISSRTRDQVVAMRVMPARKTTSAQNAPSAVDAVKTLPAETPKALGYNAD